MNKKDLNEREICSKFITPAIERAGWDVLGQVREEVRFTAGRVIVRGKMVTRGKGKRADYILFYKPNIPMAVIEAKDNHHPVGGGTQQAIVRLPNSVFRPYASIGTNLLFFVKGEPTRETWFYEHRVPEGQKAYSMTKPITLEHLRPCIDWWEQREETDVAWKVGIDEIKQRSYNLDFKNPNVEEENHGDPVELLAKLETSESEAARLRDRLKGILGEALLR